MKVWHYQKEGYLEALELLVNRSDTDLQEHDAKVREIVEDIRLDGDDALLKYTNQYDRTDFSVKDLEVKPEDIRKAYQDVGVEELEALRVAADNIRKYHQRQTQESWEYTEDDICLGQMVRPIQKVGIYVPGGKASYPSSILMNAIPAQVGGVCEIVMVSPTPGGEQNSHCLVAADLAGVDRIFRVGGAQAISALAYGTALIPKVDKIVGPGNIYVALAKRLVFGVVDIDMIAGPSEILVLADDSARADFVAADLLSQAEHDEEALPVLVTTSSELAKEVKEELGRQRDFLSRKSIIDASLDKCQVFVARSMKECVDLANRIAPEHLELAVEEPERWVRQIKNAGAVFMGHYTPEAVGDYLAGPNHVLPTSGTARFSSPLGVYDFVKRTSIIRYSQKALKKAAKACCALASMENLDAHANAVRVRVEPKPEGD